ncbi:MAG: methylenetetrahydrofolate reductase [NAD(P)H] [Bacteroidales bacterium]|jgi:methylenetetrahydrofolate reductase (NADPH)|nr:methylenetetrahydrofolate reductase [NAD(P)H] [Bacteroidales bacterium]MDD4673289.1 methylenetetrahydrofolate reductase [NAD(P)H] [Bacteroidales bacterium]MDY0347852.1 methylenetetrahydrofolate reductase [NAD(P)H] [Tenuifilaceae bacterium]
MTVPEHLNNLKGSRLSFELLPPVKGNSINSIFATLDKLMEFSPPYINITYHREELTYVTKNGVKQPAIVHKRPGTVSIAAAIKGKYKVDVVPHIICGGFSQHETEDALIDLDFLGIKNLLALRGDADKRLGKFKPNPEGHQYAADLVSQIMNMNKGIYLEKYVENPSPTNFSVGVAGYPEKHKESPSLETDMLHLKQKVDAGAEYIVTQMFFDNRVYFEFVKRCRDLGITVPIIPGLKPIAVKAHHEMLPKTFGLTIPTELSKQAKKCRTNKDVWQLGVEWAIAQSKELLANGAPLIHLYTMSRAENIVAIAKSIA